MSGVPKRPLGSTGEMVSIIGVGGGHVGSGSLSDKEAVHLVQYAIDHGITFMDNAWEYAEGRAESRMGQAIADRRDKVFLMTKVCARDRDGARRQLEDSLRRLRTDLIDLWQFHEVNYGNDPEWIFDPGGAIHAAREALETGKVRFVGFTGHKEPAYHLAMLDQDYPWAALQMPVNVMDASYRSFVNGVLPEAKQRGIGVIGMKSLGGSGQLVTEAGVAVEDCIGYALSQPIATLVCGMQSIAEVDQNVAIASDFQPMTESELAALVERTRPVATDGRFEYFKTMQYFDSGMHQRQHGFKVSG
ncbi:MAG TPA: aldo/keto reductase [Spirochaetia bacterium]|nr:aldo/keto reductase [Spirochaetia bacterium]